MPIAIKCEIGPDAIPKLRELRARHLQYISNHQSEILFGGPARDSEGVLQTMIIILKIDQLMEAERFIQNEPYTASKAMFSKILIRVWSQVVPEQVPNALSDAIAAELLKSSS